jgi:hypothetical protein
MTKFKNRQKIWTDTSLKTYGGKQARKKMLNIFGHLGNLNTTTTKYHHMPLRVAEIKETCHPTLSLLGM